MTFDPLGRYLNMRSLRHQRRDNLRPLNGNESVDVALKAYRSLGWPMLKSTVISAAIGMGALLFLYSFAIPGLFTTTKAGDQRVEFIEAAISLCLAVGVAIPLLLLAVGMGSAVVVQMASDFMIGASLNAELSAERARKIWPRVVAVLMIQGGIGSLGLLGSFVMLLVSGNISTSASDANAPMAGAISGLAMIGFMVGGIWMVYCIGRWSLALPAVVLDDLKPIAAMKRAETLYSSRGSIPSALGGVWNLLGLIFLVLVFYSIGIGALVSLLTIEDFYNQMVAGLPYRMVWEKVFEMIPMFLTVWFLVPLWGIGCTIIYYERRVRLEGLDVEILAQEVWKRTKGNRFQL